MKSGGSMKYILCEDSGSGLIFFQQLSKYFSKEDCKVLTSSGNSTYLDSLESLINDLSEYDTLILAFDSVEITDNFNPRNIINTAKYYCDLINVKLYYTCYYCFEELFLSYKFLKDMFISGSYNKDDKDLWYDILNYIYTSIQSGDDYYDSSNDFVKYVKQSTDKARKTKEKFTKAVLTHVSGSIFGDFKITDGHFGNCWLTCCSDVNIRNKQYRCSKCNSNFKCANSMEKLLELEKHSMSAKVIPFSNVISN